MRLSSDTCVSYRCTLFVCLQGPVCKVSAHFLSVPLIFTLLLDPLLSSSPTTSSSVFRNIYHISAHSLSQDTFFHGLCSASYLPSLPNSLHRPLFKISTLLLSICLQRPFCQITSPCLSPETYFKGPCLLSLSVSL